MINKKFYLGLLGLVVAGLVTAQAQDEQAKSPDKDSQEQAAPSGPPAPPVGFVVIDQPKSINLIKNLPGRLEASRNALVRARVTGIVQARLFVEGSYVQAGDPLFKIDDSDFRASLATAKAQLRQAQAAKKLNEADVRRYRRLSEARAIPRQLYEQAQTTLETTNANIDIAQAAIDQAQLNLDYANVTAPISGYIGKSDVTEGALVSAAAATQMAQIQQLNPLFINIKQPASEMLKLRKIVMSGLGESSSTDASALSVKVFLSDGTPYEEEGRLLFADIGVDEETGEASLQANLPNPDRLLMPGLYVRVEVPQAKVNNAVLVPQQAVTRGEADIVQILNDDNTFEARQVTVAQSQNNQWLITNGLSGGDKVIVDGMQMVQIMRSKKVTPVPWEAK